MRGLSDPDSKIYGLLSKVTLTIELNLWVLLGCLPVVTAGASLCSMHTVLLKIYRDEEKHVLGDFLRALKSNWRNGTILWLLFLGYAGFLAGLAFLAVHWFPASSVYLLYGALVAAVIGILYLDWTLILQSRYDYTVTQCLKYAVLAWLQYPGSTVVYLVSLVIPGLLFCALESLPLILLGGIALPHLISTTLYSRVFDRMEGVPDKVPEL